MFFGPKFIDSAANFLDAFCGGSFFCLMRFHGLNQLIMACFVGGLQNAGKSLQFGMACGRFGIQCCQFSS